MARAALLEFCGSHGLPDDDLASLSQPEDRYVDGVGDVWRSAGGHRRSDLLRVCPCGRIGRISPAPCAWAACRRGAGRAGAGDAADYLLLLGLLQHHLSWRRGATAGADDSAGRSSLAVTCPGLL